MQRKLLIHHFVKWTGAIGAGAALLLAGCASQPSAKENESVQEPRPLDEPAKDDAEPSQTAAEPSGERPPAPESQTGPAEQPTNSYRTGGQTQPEEQEPSEQELDAFVATYRDVAAVQTQYRQRIRQTADSAKAQSLQREAQQKIQQVIAQGELPPQKFKSILEKMQRDMELRQRIADKMQGG